ncbi:MAG TPA: VOC family protein [Allosphingosinicella sp.]|jgi:catechol 2,3-dioxygenase-like lactoylglutathione lyase family enzyme
MATPRIEHVNLTVRNPDRSAATLERIFGWTVRWQGQAMNGGRTVHVGSAAHYLALYTAPGTAYPDEQFRKGQPLNHVGVEVDDLDAVEARVVEAGLKPFSHGDYEPGRRFYFFDGDGIEFEVVSYAQPEVRS